MTSSSIFARVFLFLILASEVNSFLVGHMPQQIRKFNRGPLMSRTDESQTIPGDDLQSAARRAVILAEIDATNEMSGPSNSCCSDGVCFIEPPATAIGLSIRCLLSQNGLDVEWINPENEVAQAPKSVLITDFLNDYDDDDESSSNE